MSNQKHSLTNCIFILFILLLLPTFFFREYRLIKSKKDVKVLVLEENETPSLVQVNEKTFTVIIFTHNDESVIEKNIIAMINQEYDAFKIVYIDRGSTDNTVAIIENHLKDSFIDARLIKCKNEQEVCYAYYHLVSQADPKEIVIHSYGDYYLINNHILHALNEQYQDPDIWLMYGQSADQSFIDDMSCDVDEKQCIGTKKEPLLPWIHSPLKAYYAQLFHQLDIDPSICMSINSEHIFLQLLEASAKTHIRCISEILLVYEDCLHTQDEDQRKLIDIKAISICEDRL